MVLVVLADVPDDVAVPLDVDEPDADELPATISNSSDCA